MSNATQRSTSSRPFSSGSSATGRHLMFHLYPKQGVAFFSAATEILYGGAAGGGKSHPIRAAAIGGSTGVARPPRGGCYPLTDNTLPFRSITAWARASNFQNGRFLTSQWFPDKATSAQTNSRAASVVLNQIDDLWSPSTFHHARDPRSSCRILACHPVTHAKLRLSCGAHPR